MKSSFHLLVPMEVRWADMDSMGHVNNAVYFTYCESARMRYFDAVDMFEHQEQESHGPALAAANLNFRQQVRYPAELEVGVRTVSLSRRSFELDYAIFRKGTEEVVADGSSVVAWVDYDAGKAIPLPQALRESIQHFEGGNLS